MQRGDDRDDKLSSETIGIIEKAIDTLHEGVNFVHGLWTCEYDPTEQRILEEMRDDLKEAEQDLRLLISKSSKR